MYGMTLTHGLLAAMIVIALLAHVLVRWQTGDEAHAMLTALVIVALGLSGVLAQMWWRGVIL